MLPGAHRAVRHADRQRRRYPTNRQHAYFNRVAKRDEPGRRICPEPFDAPIPRRGAAPIASAARRCFREVRTRLSGYRKARGFQTRLLLPSCLRAVANDANRSARPDSSRKRRFDIDLQVSARNALAHASGPIPIHGCRSLDEYRKCATPSAGRVTVIVEGWPRKC